LKVLQINSVCGVGSTGRMTTDLYKVLKEQLHECIIAYGRGNAPNNIDSIKIGLNFDNYIHGLKTRLADNHGFGSVKPTKEFIKKIKDYDPDIIHLHNLHGYYVDIQALFDYLSSANKPVIWSLHDCWSFTGHCAYFDYIGCNKWKTGCHQCQQKKEYPSSIFLENSKKNYERKKKLFTSIGNMTLVTPSAWLMDLVKQSFLRKYPVKVINYGIDLNAFKPTGSNLREKYNINNRFIILGVASTWVRRKGLHSFIELSKKLDDRYKIILVGPSEKQKLQLPRNILAIKRTGNIKELAKIYTAADVFVNPSVEETMGIVTVEALACGTPAVVYNSTATPEVVDNNCGRVVKKDNINDLIEAITACRNNNFLSENCIKRAKFFDRNRKYDEYALQYANSLDENKLIK
jgi:putative colanic acid biosynthesis glycosyltransferase